MNFVPDYRQMITAARNRKPARLPIYEHQIDPSIMAQVMDTDMSCPDPSGSEADFRDYYSKLCRFWREMTYDTVSFEAQICPLLPDHGAIMGGRPCAGPPSFGSFRAGRNS